MRLNTTPENTEKHVIAALTLFILEWMLGFDTISHRN